MKYKFLGLVVAGMMLMGAPVHAAAVLTVAGGSPTTIGAETAPGSFNDFGVGLNDASPITLFNSSTVGAFGLSVSEAANITFEFLGKEAGFNNTFQVGANTFINNSTAPGTTFNADLNGLLPFVLTSAGLGETATNGGPIQSPLAYAIAVLSETAVVILFDDGGIGTDLDDMAVRVSVSQVPLPAAAWLLISAILGLVSFARIRRGEAQTA